MQEEFLGEESLDEKYMGEKHVQEEFLGEESLGERGTGEKYVQEEFLGEECLGEKYTGEKYVQTFFLVKSRGVKRIWVKSMCKKSYIKVCAKKFLGEEP